MEFSFRRLARTDFEMLARWLAEPPVRRWWNHDFSAEAIERDFGPSIDRADPTETWVALLVDSPPVSPPGQAQPIGLIQYHFLHDHPQYVEELAPIIETPPDAGSIDYLIGEPDHLGRGAGTAMITAFVERLWSTQLGLGSLIVPVVAANVPSWRALLRAGFEQVAEGDLEPDNPIDDPAHVIMAIRRPPSSDEQP